jgi:general secretion pathway protein G
MIQSRQHRRRGFSLVEMLLVLVILATLAAIVVPRFAGRSEQAKITAAQTQITSISTALDSFEVDNGFYPPSGEGITQLATKPDTATNWRGPYLKQGVPNDPWGSPYLYEFPGKNNAQGYDLSSMGPDARAGNEDDIKNWK